LQALRERTTTSQTRGEEGQEMKEDTTKSTQPQFIYIPAFATKALATLLVQEVKSKYNLD
jgi:hypothetical protein